MNSAPTAEPPAPAAQAAPAETPGLGDKAVVILFLVGVALLGLISLVDLLSNVFR